MKFNIIYKKEEEWFIGHVQEYPDYIKVKVKHWMNQKKIYNDINQGLVPDAEPF